MKKADIGVLPGQMPGGRWFDAHNACAVYHNILLRDLLELLRALPAGHDFRATLLDALTRGLDQAAVKRLRMASPARGRITSRADCNGSAKTKNGATRST